jgi:carbon storage regulator
MLVLTRKEGQSLVIDGKSVIRIIEIRRNSIRIGIEAAQEVAVVRSELVGRAPGYSATSMASSPVPSP